MVYGWSSVTEKNRDCAASEIDPYPTPQIIGNGKRFAKWALWHLLIATNSWNYLPDNNPSLHTIATSFPSLCFLHKLVASCVFSVTLQDRLQIAGWLGFRDIRHWKLPKLVLATNKKQRALSIRPNIPVWNSGYSMRQMDQYFPVR